MTTDRHPANEALNRTVKQMEWWQLLRGAVPLIAIGIGIGWLYAVLAGDPSARRLDHAALPADLPGVGAGVRGRDHPAVHGPLSGHTVRVTSPRLVLRPAVAADREAVIEVETDAEVRRYLGGPRDAGEVATGFDQFVADGLPLRRGHWAVALVSSDERIGVVMLNRRDPARPGHIVDTAPELELSYVLRRSAWGHGYALEACRLLLADAVASMPDQPVVVVTQTANAPSIDLALRLGFEPVTTFEEFGAEQTLLSGSLHSLRAD